MTATTVKKPTEAERFSYQGEFLDIDLGDPRLPIILEKLATMGTAAIMLHAAKKSAFDAEEDLKLFMQGYENLRVMGEVKVTWRWKLKTYFDKRQLQRDNAALVEQYTVRTPDGERRFDCKGVVGVD